MNLDIAYGRAINDNDLEELSSIAVIGYNIADKLFGRQDVVGERFNIIQTGSKGSRKITFEVVGVLKKTGSRLLFNVDDLVVLPYNIADYRLFHTKVELTKYWYLQLMKKKCATCHNGYRFLSVQKIPRYKQIYYIKSGSHFGCR